MAAGGNDRLVKGLPGNPALQGNFIITDTDQRTALLTLDGATGNLTVSGTVSSAGAVDNSGNLALAGNIAVNTNKFTVAGASGNTVIAGTLAVTGVATHSALIDLSGIAASGAELKIAATSDTPTVAFGADASHNPSTAPAGYLKVTVGSSSRYIPFWA